MDLLRFLTLFAVLAACGLGPGLAVVRWLRWKPAETWCAAIGLSLVFVYLASFGLFALDLPRPAYFAVTAFFAVVTVACAGDLLRLLRYRPLRCQCRTFAWLLAWGLLLLALVRNYSGGAWYGDWLEHYQRSCFFIRETRADPNFKFLGAYLLPARPPMENLIAAFVLVQVGLDTDNIATGYDSFQVVFLVLNLLIIFPLFLAAPAFGPQARRNRAVVVLLLLANPMLWQNATWTWTKLLAGYYVVLALWFYLSAWRKADPVRLSAAFLSLAAGCLVHYSVAPYLLVFGLHYLVFVWPKRRPVGELAAVVLPGAVLLASWLGWSAAVYGVRTTLLSNTTMTPLERGQDPLLLRTAKNIAFSIVPHPLHLPRETFDREFAQPSGAGYLRDSLFLIYQTNYLAAMGAAGGPVAVYLFVRMLGRRRPGWGSWALLVPACAVLGVAVHTMPDAYGLAHICGQPLVLLGVAFLAASFRSLPPWLRWCVLAAAVVDFALGVLLHFHLENYVYHTRETASGWLVEPSPDDPSRYALANWIRLKVPAGYVFFGDHFAVWAGVIQAALLVSFAAALAGAARLVSSWPASSSRSREPDQERPTAALSETERR